MSIPKMAKAMNNIDDDLVSGAVDYKRTKKKHGWLKWGAMAACLCLVVVGVFGMLQNGPGGSKHTVTFENGDTLEFVKSNTVGMGLSDVKRSGVESHNLTASEVQSLFHKLPVTAIAYFNEETDQFVALEGKLENVTFAITAPGTIFAEAITVSDEQTSTLEGVPVAAGYFVTDANSKGETTTIYYATFELGEYTVYVEQSGLTNDSEAVRTEVATTVQSLIGNGEISADLISAKD